MYEEYRARLQGTTIDPNTFLSTDYFNHFNEAIMLFAMLPDMPEMIEEIDLWKFRSYCEHFQTSGLAFADLAIELYPLAPQELRDSLEALVDEMRITIETARTEFHGLLARHDTDVLADKAVSCSIALQRMVDEGSAIVHGFAGSLDQSAIDDLF
jgi:hypothetical protein